MKQFPGEKRILVVNPVPVYPVKAMNQMRTNNMIRVLSRDFAVTLAAPSDSDEDYIESVKYMKKYGGDFYSLGTVKPKNNIIRRRLSQIYEYTGYYIFGYDKEVLTYRRYTNKILDIIHRNNFNIIISNYWEGSVFFRKLSDGIFKILDPHYSVAENRDVFNNKKLSGVSKYLEKRRLTRNSKTEKEIVQLSDLTLPLSKRNLEEFKKIAPNKDALLIPDGNDLEYFSSYPVNPDSKTILFYGAMGSIQNQKAFFRFYDNIYKKLLKDFKELRLLVVGANPPESILKLNNDNGITVTGYVDDVRKYLSKAWFKVLPLELGSGFRGRIVEVMAMGIPVIGTHNALDSVGFTDGIEGYITDSDDDILKYCKLLLTDSELRNRLSKSSADFVINNYSLESTFGKLNEYLKND